MSLAKPRVWRPTESSTEQLRDAFHHHSESPPHPGRLRGLAKSSARPFACRDELVAANVWIVRQVAFDGYLTCTTGAQKLSTESEILAVSRWSFSGFDGKLRWREELVSIRSGDDAPAFRSGSRIA
ncbi:MAG: hypothetical protein KF861_07730 [Planctomycetaceae bacterium]|nr:hypothetical protein [Planctomycetaceae bacterium]